jgi:kinesin family protein 1
MLNTELELQENLETSEKLMATLNESWEDKLAKTQVNKRWKNSVLAWIKIRL